MAHIYRCSRCRTRNTFRRAADSYLRPKSCRDCGYQKFYSDKERVYRPVCKCSGSYHFPHRVGAKYCEKHPDHEYDRAIRAGAHPGELAFEGIGLKLHTGDTIPF